MDTGRVASHGANKWMSITMLITYGIIGTITHMISALGIVGGLINVVGLIAAIVGFVKLIKAARRHEAKTVHWILLVVYVVLYYLALNVAFI